MDKQTLLTQSEWKLMELLWQAPHTLMELVAELGQTMLWTKSTVATMVRRMETKGLIRYETVDRTKHFLPCITREEASLKETHSLLSRAYQGSIGLMVSSLIQQGSLTREDIDELYAVLRQAEEEQS